MTAAGAAANTSQWEARGVDLATVLAVLTRMHADGSRAEADDAHPHPRNCVLNLVGVAPDAGGSTMIERTAAAVAAEHPLRLVTIVTDGEDPDRVDARVSTHAHDLGSGLHVQAELVRLRVAGDLSGRFDSLVEPLLVSDVPTILWWLGTPPLGRPELAEGVELADALVVDTSTFERPFESALALAALVESGAPVCDLQWWRQRSWLQLLAQVFNPVERRTLLHGINGVGIDFAGEGRANRVAAAMLAGWLAARLGWQIRKGAAGTGGAGAVFYTAPAGHPVEINLRSVSADPGTAAGSVMAVRIEAAGGGRTAGFGLVRSPAAGGRVTLTCRIGDAEPMVEDLSFAVPGEAELLVDAVVAPQPDPVYEAAMIEAGRMLGSFR